MTGAWAVVGLAEPGGGGGTTLAGAALRLVGAAGVVDSGTVPMRTGASEDTGFDVGLEGGGAFASC